MNNRYQISIICESAENVSAEVVWLQTCRSVLARPEMRKRKRDEQKRGSVSLKYRAERFIGRSEHWGGRYTHQNYCIHTR